MKNKSFTLIELLVVIVIIGILASVIIVSVSSSINKANFAKAQSFSNTVQNELLGDLVSEWTFNSPAVSGKTEDSWGNNDGTLVGTNGLPELKTKENCVYGTCYSFDGTDDYLSVPNNSSLNFGMNDFTISAWVKTADDRGPIVGKKYFDGFTILGYGIGISSYKYAFQATDGSVDSLKSNMSVSNNWSHVVGVRTGTNRLIYINGILDNSDNDGGFNINSGSNVFLGWSTYASQYLNGLIDDVRIYNAALSSAQIKQQYVAGLDSLLSKNLISLEEYNEKINSLASN